MKVFFATDTGLVRKTNQDSYAGQVLCDGAAWAGVFDGMGGANGGDYASSHAAKVVSEKLAAGYSASLSDCSLRNLISCAVSAANSEVYERSRVQISLAGMGTTVVLAVVRGDTATIAHAGDSRAYLISPDSSRRLTTDHSIVQAMVDCGQITEQEAVVHPRRNVITRALGVGSLLEIDFNECRIAPGEMILLCSDGLSNYLSIEEISMVAQNVPVGELADELVAMANDRGGADNITCAIIYAESEENEVRANG